MNAEHPCAFCTNSENKEREITRNEFVWAFPTNIPIVPEHLLVAPLRCVPTMGDLSSEEREALLVMVEELKEPLRVAFGAEGFNQAWNEGESAGQTVSHVHIHLLPRKRGDEGVTNYEPRQFLYRPGSRETSPQSELLTIAEQVRNALRS